MSPLDRTDLSNEDIGRRLKVGCVRCRRTKRALTRGPMKPELVQDEDPEPPGTKPEASPSFTAPEPHTRPAAQPRLQPVPASKPTVPRLTISPRSDAFRRRFYPQATARDWNDWRWQNR